MLTITTNLTSEEWQKVQKQASQQCPGERLSNAEICRRFTLIGTQYTKRASALDKASKAELEQIKQELRASMAAPDSEPSLEVERSPTTLLGKKHAFDLNQRPRGYACKSCIWRHCFEVDIR